MNGRTTLLAAAPAYLRLRRSQYWPRQRLRAWVEARLAETLAAAARIPFYRPRVAGVSSVEQLAQVPVLERADVPDLERSVRALHPAGTPFLCSRTSGSTGMPVPFLFDASHQRGRFAARSRYLRSHGWSPLRRTAWIIQVRPDTPDEALLRRPRLLGNRFFSHITALEEQAAWLRALDPLYLYTFPANLDGLTRIFASERTPLPALRKVFTGSEVLDDSQREQTRTVLGVEVADNYGSTEAFLAWECPAGSNHVNAEHVHLEIVDDAGGAVAAGGIGRVLVTTLENRLMPLVRYAIGDYAEVVEGPCACGRTLPRIGRIIGRAINLFVDARGRMLVPWTLLRVLKEHDSLRQYQIVQRQMDRVLVRFASERDLNAAERAEITSRFEAIMGCRLAVEFERLDAIPRAPSGKFMPAISEIGADLGR